MSVALASEIWRLVRDCIQDDELDQLADSFVGILVDHGVDLDDIRYEFDDDPQVQTAIKYYADETEIDEGDYYSDEDEDQDW